MAFFKLMISVHVIHILISGGVSTAAAPTSSSSSSGSCLAKEREALLDLKNSAYQLYGAQWNISNDDCCMWDGIECDESTGRIIHIHLTLVSADYDENGAVYQNPCGPLPSSIANLESLQTLDLSGSCFADFPQPFPTFPNLTHLNFSSTRLGTFPPGLGSINSLLYLNFADNMALSGTIPPEWGNLSNLQHLEMGVNSYIITWNLTDWDQCKWSALTYLSIPTLVFPAPYFSSLPSCLKQVIPKLKYLDLSSVSNLNYSVLESLLIEATNLTELFLTEMYALNPDPSQPTTSDSAAATWGRIPDWLRRIGPQLQTFHVSNCRITGSIHPTWFRENMLQLKDFDASLNSLTGPLSSLLSPNMSALEFLDLSQNRLSSLGDLPTFPTSILHMDLSNNNIYGAIPVSVLANSSTRLQYLDLSQNGFYGPLPFASGSEWISLTDLDLWDNQFSGGIPDSMGNMSALIQLSLSDNDLSGCIPDSLGNLLGLSIGTFRLYNNNPVGLFLNGNMLNCSIPASLGRLGNLLALDLSKNLHLEGQIPTSFTNLTNLIILDLSFNNLTGSIPNGFCNISAKSGTYAVSLSSNQLVGTIPACLIGRGISASYITLDISNNQISGTMPSSVWSRLTTGTALSSFYLDLSHNQLSGSLPTSIIYNQTVSMFVDVSYNNLSGVLPVQSNIPSNCLYSGFQWYSSHNSLSGQLLPSFINVTCTWIETTYKKYATISLQNNFLSGTIPESLGLLSGLRYLSLSGNDFTGSIPASLTNSGSLQYFDVSFNKLSGNIPSWGDGTPYLWAIILSDNELDGVIPPSLANLSILAVLDVSNNHLSGIIPFTMFMTNENSSLPPLDESVVDVARWDALRLKQIVKNHGKVDVWGSLSDVSQNSGTMQKDSLGVGFFSLNLSHNMLTGPIPKGLANMSTLELLDLSSNQLSGTIPTELLQLTSLTNLNLSYNRLEGPIPQGNQFNTFTNDSFDGNPGLCGPPLSKLCSSVIAVHPPAGDPVEQETNSSFLSRIQEVVSLEGVGIGYAIGLLVVGYFINYHFL